MSDNIPFDLQVDIIKKAPVKALIRFRSVSKQWKSLIDSSQFIIDHSRTQTRLHHLLLSYKVDNKEKYVSIVDDDSFPHNKFSPIRPPPNVNSISHAIMLDCSHGLVCLYDFHQDITDGKDVIVLWNPSIRKSVEIVLPHGLITVVGVGVCRKTSDPKIVKVSADWKAEVFTLRTGAWRSISMNLCRPLKPFIFNDNQVVMDGVIHWVAYDLVSKSTVIISFDLTSEGFEKVALPDCLSGPSYQFIYNINESLALIDYKQDRCDVWMMIKNGDPKSPFTKLFKIDFETLIYNFIIGFRMNGQPIMEEVDTHDAKNPTSTIKVYEPCSKHSKNFEIVTAYRSWSRMITSYTESLLLLDHFTYNIQ